MPEIIGASLAGCVAALDLLAAGQGVRLYEKSRFPRHKVCGEFLDGQVRSVLARHGLETAVDAHEPAAITHAALIWGERRKSFLLPRPAIGISRYVLDELLLRACMDRGAELVQSAGTPSAASIVAHGRKPKSQRGQRFFGYKAHFHGPPNEANSTVELYFQGLGYTGVNGIERGRTNVCGLALEEDLKACGFDGDAWVQSQAALRQRIQGMERQMDWLFTGPLFYGPVEDTVGYPCGDALSFVDPFTGSGMLCAFVTGQIAAQSILAGRSPEEHLAACRSVLLPAFRWSSLFRESLQWPVTPYLAGLLPGGLLYGRTRPVLS
jgi:menaquinone-9 beta-reductase